MGGCKNGKRDDALFRAHLQGGRETEETCGAVNWFEPEEVEEDKSSKKREMHDSHLWKCHALSVYSNCALSIVISLFQLLSSQLQMQNTDSISVLPFKDSLGG